MTTKCFILAASISLFFAVLPAGAISNVEFEQLEGKVRVTFDGMHFTDYIYEGHTKPVMYPVNFLHAKGPFRATRDYPFKDTDGEAKDHPHHESLWYSHGDVDGVDYWHHGEDKGEIVQTSLKIDHAIVTENEWRKPDGTVQLTDSRRIQFGVVGSCGPPKVTFEITLKASHGDLTFGDTKEGSFGIRTHPNLRLKNGKGVTTANGKAINSGGVKGADIWGKPAKWVTFSGEIDGRISSISILDHVANPRHPTRWHARDYGLIAANPFGNRAFGDDGGEAFKIKKGESVTFRYQLIFGAGDVDARRAWNAWTRYWNRQGEAEAKVKATEK